MKSDPVEGKPCDGYISSGERMLAGGRCVVGGRTPAKPRWSEVMIFFGDFLRREAPNRRNLSAPMSGSLIGGQPCAGYINSDERMLAGGRCVVGGCTPAKPRWSEMMMFWYLLLRQSSPLPEEFVSSDERFSHRRTALRRLLSSGERMLAGGRCVVGGRTPAKPRWSEVMIILCDFLRQGSPSQEENK
jgi:hypothetical protein